jgi:hypothetical protein
MEQGLIDPKKKLNIPLRGKQTITHWGNYTY